MVRCRAHATDCGDALRQSSHGPLRIARSPLWMSMVDEAGRVAGILHRQIPIGTGHSRMRLPSRGRRRGTRPNEISTWTHEQ